MKWWGYIHVVDRNLILKRYYDYEDINDAERSDFVSVIIQPFRAGSRVEALEILKPIIKRT